MFLFLLARIYGKQNKYKESTEAVGRIKELTADHLEDLMEVANLHLEQRSFSTAKELLSMALKLDPDNQSLRDKVEQIKDNE